MGGYDYSILVLSRHQEEAVTVPAGCNSMTIKAWGAGSASGADPNKGGGGSATNGSNGRLIIIWGS